MSGIYHEPLYRFAAGIIQLYKESKLLKGVRLTVKKLHDMLGRTDYPTTRKYVRELADKDLFEITGDWRAKGCKLVIRQVEFDPEEGCEVPSVVELVSEGRAPIIGKVAGAGIGGAAGGWISASISHGDPLATAFGAGIGAITGALIGHVIDMAIESSMCPRCGEWMGYQEPGLIRSCHKCGVDLFKCTCGKRMELLDLPNQVTTFRCSCGSRWLICPCGQVNETDDNLLFLPCRKCGERRWALPLCGRCGKPLEWRGEYRLWWCIHCNAGYDPSIFYNRQRKIRCTKCFKDFPIASPIADEVQGYSRVGWTCLHCGNWIGFEISELLPYTIPSDFKYPWEVECDQCRRKNSFKLESCEVRDLMVRGHTEIECKNPSCLDYFFIFASRHKIRIQLTALRKAIVLQRAPKARSIDIEKAYG
ncbi:MAG: hypothetical protein QMD10_09575 [Desulfitobacteriaceae bacterium]|nr:hypothetical protein [Desulfitobacteriaceae bacterium]